jgi:uncharacterized membrane protein (DUF4010 family)
LPDTLLNLIVALGVGLLVGIERERAHPKVRGEAVAGVRTFTIAAIAGAIAMLLGGALLLATVVIGVGVLAGLAYWRTLTESGPGLTTEVALILTLLLGGLSMIEPAAAGAVAVITALLLASRERMHHFASAVLTEDEIRSALILAGAVIVVLPLMPDAQMGPYNALNPRSIWKLVVLVLLIGAAGQAATRVLGPRFGLPISGLASGFVSSAATIGAMGARAVQTPEASGAAAAGAVLSTVATVIQMAVVVGAMSESALRAMTAPLLGAGLTAVAYGAVFTLLALRRNSDGGERRASSAFSVSAALIFAATLSVVLLGSAALREWFGEAGAIAAASIAGFVDTHSSAISIASLVANARLAPEDCVVPILAGFTTNTVTKVILAATSGGRDFALRVIPGVILVALGAWAGALVSFSAA